ncbi:MAG: twin-arginine translocase TatA/TatE family subunit [bacterium]|jgi:sec-independent protein translocase protein TatA
MFGFGSQELLLILLAVLVLFGGTQIPRLFKGLGQGIKEFKSAVKDEPAKPDAVQEKPAEPVKDDSVGEGGDSN